MSDWADEASKKVAAWHCQAEVAAALRKARADALDEAASAAVGPVYRVYPKTGEPSLHGTDAGNWSVPQPLSGFTGSDYGKGRYDAAAAVRSLKDKQP